MRDFRKLYGMTPTAYRRTIGRTPNDDDDEKETFSHFRQNLAVFDNKQSLTTLAREHRLPSPTKLDKSKTES